VPLPADVAGSIVLAIVFSLLALGLFFKRTARLASNGERFQANRVEKALAGIGIFALLTVLGIWLAQSASAQHQMDQAGTALTDSVQGQLDDATDVLVINWPEEISQTFPNALALSPLTGFVGPSLEEMGATSATAVIYPSWAETVNRVHRWDTHYHGYHVTTEMLVKQIFNARRIVTANMVTDAPQMWRVADITDMDAGAVPADLMRLLHLSMCWAPRDNWSPRPTATRSIT
jgi:hypothetical protein